MFLLSAAFMMPLLPLSDRDGAINPHRAMILDLSGRNASADTELTALKHCFDIFAVTYTVTRNMKDAEKASVIFTAGDLRNTTFSPAELQSLYEYVENGGVLVSQVVIGNKLFPLFGMRNVIDSRKRWTIRFRERETDRALKYLDRPEERTVLLGSRKLYRETVWTHAFETTEAEPLADTDDGSVIFSVNRYGAGSAYALGVSLSDTVLLPHVGNDYEAQRVWINGFEPGSDVFLLIMKSLYEEYTSPYIYLSTAPYGKKTSLILSHDVDAQSSFANSVRYAELEKKYGVSATYFITTKYFKDETDIGYYDAERKEFVREVKLLGGDIGSHTVSHSLAFEKFPPGKNNVEAKSYPGAAGKTVFGEVKISKELLDRDIPSQRTDSFRSGYLRYPERLIEILEACGYRYDSSFSADDIMCNYAFRAFRQRRVGSPESSVIEIPVVFDDSQGLLTPDNIDELVAKWSDVIGANGDNEAISTLLIHPSETGYKLEAEEKLLSRFRNQDIWIGNLSEYGKFWAARSAVDYESVTDGKVLKITIKNAEIDERMCFCVKDVPAAGTIILTDRNNRPLPFTETRKNGIILLNIVR
jgi:peptidoglycan/xylan/chitin deacetylase (PgdA/CDA1 family)